MVEIPIIQEASISAVVGQSEPINLDLGNIDFGKSADGMISIKQSIVSSLIPSGLVGGKLVVSGADELSIISQSGCTSIKKSTGTCSIKVRANTQGLEEGTSISGYIFFHLDENTQEETFIQISATVGSAPVVETPALVSSSSNAAFGNLTITDSSKDIILTYKALSLISSSDLHEVVVPAPFVIQAASADRCSNKTISKGASCTVKIRLDPKLISSNGLVSGNIAFAGLSIPVSATISGNPEVGQPAQSQLAWIYNGSEISSLDLGTLLSSNVPSKFNLYLKNKSASSEEVNVIVAGSGFNIINRCLAKELDPQGQCSLEVRPEQSAGLKNVNLTVENNSISSFSLLLEVIGEVVVPVITYQTVDTTASCPSLNLQVCGGTQNISKTYSCEQYVDGIKNNSYSGNGCQPLEDMTALSCQSPSGSFQENISNGTRTISCDLGSSNQNISYACNSNFNLVGNICQADVPSGPLLPLISLNGNTMHSANLTSSQITSLAVQSSMTDVSFYKGNDCNPVNKLTPTMSFFPYSAFMTPYPNVAVGINYVSANGKVNGVDTLCGYTSFNYDIPDTTAPILSVNMDNFTTFANKMPELEISLSDNKGLSSLSYTVSSIEYDSEIANEYDIENDVNKYYWGQINFDDTPQSLTDTIINENFTNSVYEIFSYQDRLFPYNEEVFVLFKLCDTSYNCTIQSLPLTSTQNIPSSIDFYFSQNLTAQTESQRELVRFAISPAKLNQINFGSYNQHARLDYFNARGNLLSISSPLVFDASGANSNYLSTNNYMDETLCSSIGGEMNFSNVCITPNKQQCIDLGNVYVEIYSGSPEMYRDADPYDTFYNQSCRSNQFSIGYTDLNVASYGSLTTKQKLAYDSLKFFDDNCVVNEYGEMNCDFPEGSPLTQGDNQNATKFLIATNGGEVVELNTITGTIANIATNSDLSYSNQLHFTEVAPFTGDIYYGDTDGPNAYLYAALKYTIHSSQTFYMNQSPLVRIEGESTKGLFFTNKDTLFASGKLHVENAYTLDSTFKFYKKDLRKTPFISIRGNSVINAGTVTPDGTTFNKPIYWYHSIDEDALGHKISNEIGTVSGLNNRNAFKCGDYAYVIGDGTGISRMNVRSVNGVSSPTIVSFNGSQNFPGMRKEQMCHEGKVYWMGASGSSLALYMYDPTVANTSSNPRIITISNTTSTLDEAYFHVAVSKDYVYYVTFDVNTLLYKFERVNRTTFAKQTLSLSYSMQNNLVLVSSLTVDYETNKLYLNLLKVESNNLSVLLEYDPTVSINYSVNMGNSLASLNSASSGGGQFATNNPRVLKAFPEGTNFDRGNTMSVVKNQLIYLINSTIFNGSNHAVRAFELTTKQDKLIIPMNSATGYQSLNKIKAYGNNVFLLTNDNDRGVGLDWVDLSKPSGIGSPGNPMTIRSLGSPTPTYPMIFDIFAK